LWKSHINKTYRQPAIQPARRKEMNIINFHFIAVYYTYVYSALYMYISCILCLWLGFVLCCRYIEHQM
jgi:hypothetical protein